MCNFKRRTVNSSDDAAVVDGEGVTAVDRDEEEGGFADELNTSPLRNVFGVRDLAHASDQADELSSRRGGALKSYSTTIFLLWSRSRSSVRR